MDIYIRRPWTTPQWKSTLVHEAAHKHHLLLGKQASQEWYDSFYFEVPKDNKTAFFEMIDQGVLHPYALHTNEPVHYAPPDFVMYRNNIDIGTLHGAPDLALYNMGFLPGELSDIVSPIHIDPHLPFLGLFLALGEDRMYAEVAEDIAVSCQHIYLATVIPVQKLMVLNQLRTNKKSQRRLGFLVEYGFLDGNTASLAMTHAHMY